MRPPIPRLPHLPLSKPRRRTIAVGAIITSILLDAVVRATTHCPTATTPVDSYEDHLPTLEVFLWPYHDPTFRRTVPVDTRSWTWSNFQNAWVPSSADGPHTTGHGLASGFAHNPAGALLAAINISVRATAVAGPDIFVPTITHQVHDDFITGLYRSDFLHAQQWVYDNSKEQGYLPALPRIPYHFVSYRWKGYSDSAAAADLAIREHDGSYRIARVQLQWGKDHSDWLMHPPPHLTLESAMNQNVRRSDLSGFTPIAGQQPPREAKP